jgi:hypothetical protein
MWVDEPGEQQVARRRRLEVIVEPGLVKELGKCLTITGSSPSGATRSTIWPISPSRCEAIYSWHLGRE